MIIYKRGVTTMKKKMQGFTLIELVIVIAILGILAGIGIPRFLNATATARGARIVADLRTIESAVAVYNVKTGKIPFSVAVTNPYLSTDDPANDKLLLIASYPTPPSGEIIFPCNPDHKINVPAGTSCMYWVDANGVVRVFYKGILPQYGFTASELSEGGNAY